MLESVSDSNTIMKTVRHNEIEVLEMKNFVTGMENVFNKSPETVNTAKETVNLKIGQ
jgi:hypothetical protein